ncbi:cytochrome P450 307a1 [Teleopsis dalmanni]|uniref:cytochrome P450 307a1 n=1 Tax=Teleopsis dalmanni TaxID=139649 RepID=UPI0018CE1FA1|nr:cytochrome P450 307a1 [Teleopsis dalmanni]
MLSVCTSLYLTIVILWVVEFVRVLYKYLRSASIVVNSRLQHQRKTVKHYSQAPGPIPLPVIGSLYILRKYKVPFQCFTDLAKKYGDVYSLSLGASRCLIVNNLDLIREVLNQNGKFFGGRPNFLRYHKLFGGDRNHSLALCDWSHLQQKRRNLARRYCSPRDSSSYFTKMSEIGCLETAEFIRKLDEVLIQEEAFEIKPLIQQTCANMFTNYMCSLRFDYEDKEFQKIVEYFDEIFWEINQGYAVDFLPWLAPFYKMHFNKIMAWSSTIRTFILKRIINNREQNLDTDEPENDFTDALLKSLAEDKYVSRDTIIYMLEDFIGGHSAVGNLVMLALAYIVMYPHVGAKIQAEADHVSLKGNRTISLLDIDNMPYTLATIFEVLRYSSSPIVPHVATEDCVISGYGVTAGTIVFINNYNLNTNTNYWKNPNFFYPERFLEKLPQSTKLVTGNNERRNSESSDSGVENDKESKTKNMCTSQLYTCKVCNKDPHVNQIKVKMNIPQFLPFSIGKRTCVGKNLVRGFGFILLSNILLNYNVSSSDLSSIKITPACVAVPTKSFSLVFTKRSISKS